MRYVRAAALGLCFLVAPSVDMTASKAGLTFTIASTAFAQEPNGTAVNRVQRWTRTRLEAAKKQWAKDRQWFTECASELDNVKKKSKKRLSFHYQGHFLEQCMREKQARS